MGSVSNISNSGDRKLKYTFDHQGCVEIIIRPKGNYIIAICNMEDDKATTPRKWCNRPFGIDPGPWFNLKICLKGLHYPLLCLKGLHYPLFLSIYFCSSSASSLFFLPPACSSSWGKTNAHSAHYYYYISPFLTGEVDCLFWQEG